MFARLSITVSIVSIAVLVAATPNGKRWNDPTTTSTYGHTTTSKAHTTAPAHTTTVTVTAPAANPTAGSCNTGPVQCCNSVSKASDPATSALLGLLGIVVEGVDALVGLGCSPITVIGVGSSSCAANTVCCQDNAVGGLVSIGCIPVTL